MDVDPAAEASASEAADVDFIFEDSYNEEDALKRFITNRPPGFIVIGKPGCGKSTLARNLAARTNADLIDVPSALEDAIRMGTPAGIKAKEALYSGHEASAELIMEIIEERIDSEDVAYRGYILDGFLECDPDLATQLDFLRSLHRRPDVIIRIVMDDLDLERRRVGQMIDPRTNAIYVHDQYSPRVAIVQHKKEANPPQGDGQGDGQGGDADGGEEDGGSEATAELIDGDASLDIPSADVVARLVKRREDSIGMVRDSLQLYANHSAAIEGYVAEQDTLRTVHVDGTQPLDENMRLLLDKIALMELPPVVEPIRLHLPIDVGDDLSEDVLSRLVIVDTDEASPWLPSPFGRFCPVEYMRENRALVSGKAGCAVGYLGMLFLMASDENAELFMKNPRIYLLQRPTINCRLWLLGGPVAGKKDACKGACRHIRRANHHT
eukprot:Opistho-2@21950